MGMPVVTVASGGMPVVDVTATTGRGTPVTEALNKFGRAVTKVTSGGMAVAYETIVSGGGGGPSAEATAFLARTSGLDATHVNAYTALINGLVADGIWSKLDILHVYATQDTVTAKLNLVSASYPVVLAGSGITFTADRGYDNTPQLGWMDTSFNPTTASSPKYALNSAHESFWNLTNVSVSNHACGTGGPPYCVVSPRLTNLTLIAINDGSGLNVASSDGRGHFIGTRTSSVATAGYKNGSSIMSSGALSSTVIPNLNFYVLAVNAGGSPLGSNTQGAMYSVGSAMSSAEALAFYNRLRTYMTAVGVP